MELYCSINNEETAIVPATPTLGGQLQALNFCDRQGNFVISKDISTRSDFDDLVLSRDGNIAVASTGTHLSILDCNVENIEDIGPP